MLVITCSVYCNREETCFVIFSYRSAQIFITAPNIFHLGVEETISVILYNTDKPVNVTVVAQDFPDKKRNLSAVNGVFARGKRLFIAKFTFFLFISNVKKIIVQNKLINNSAALSRTKRVQGSAMGKYASEKFC